MEMFLHTVETIPNGYGFEYYDALHITWLTAGLLFTLFASLYYKKLSPEKRSSFRKAFAFVLVLDEAWKMFWLMVGGNYLLKYLPFHLCSINIFIIAYHSFRPGKALDNFLYTVCIPGALSALLFPTWTSLPFSNFMHLHSFTVHILLAAYPVILLIGGDIRPNLKEVPKSLGLLAAFGIIALMINILLNENFMFLMYAEEGNPLLIFENAFGSHLIGFPVIIAAILFVMYMPITIYQKYKSK